VIEFKRPSSVVGRDAEALAQKYAANSIGLSTTTILHCGGEF
jgi:hypothetical protein